MNDAEYAAETHARLEIANDEITELRQKVSLLTKANIELQQKALEDQSCIDKLRYIIATNREQLGISEELSENVPDQVQNNEKVRFSYPSGYNRMNPTWTELHEILLKYSTIDYGTEAYPLSRHEAELIIDLWKVCGER